MHACPGLLCILPARPFMHVCPSYLLVHEFPLAWLIMTKSFFIEKLEHVFGKGFLVEVIQKGFLAECRQGRHPLQCLTH